MEYNFISLGDHCYSATIIKNIGMRKSAYPFDWNVMVSEIDPITQTSRPISSLPYNINLLGKLMETHNVREITIEYIGNALKTEIPEQRVNDINQLWFPHESGTVDEIFAKYERRFERLYNDIKTKQNIFVICSRYVYIQQEYFDECIMTELLKYNVNNKLIFICGKNHEYLEKDYYRKYVLFKHIDCDITHGIDVYDKIFRREIDMFMESMNNIYFD